MMIKLNDLPRNMKRAFMLLMDSFFIQLSFFISLGLYSSDSHFVFAHYGPPLFITWLCSALLFMKLGLYRAVLRYASTEMLLAIVIGCVISTVIFVGTFTLFGITLSKFTLLSFFLLHLLFTGGTRATARYLFRRLKFNLKKSVIVYGAGSAGCQLVKYLNDGDEYRVVAIVDDEPSKQNSLIMGVRVHSPKNIAELINKEQVSTVLLAVPSASSTNKKEILNTLETHPVDVKTIPSLKDIIEGKSSSLEIKDIDVNDLLGRDSVDPDFDLMSTKIKHRSILVTGAGGSIGSELCRQIITLQPKKIVLFELSEFALYSIDKELRDLADKLKFDVQIVPIMGSIQHKKRILAVMKTFNIDTVFHAAAYKHVPLVENNVVEGVRNNIFGTLFVAQAAIDAGVKDFTLVSTDKAVRPTNIMGATKRMAELILQALNKEKCTTNFNMVRFGNVLGSSGSVVPLFKKQIAQGGPITLTHPDITRFFMTIPEAAQLVLQAGAMARGGDVFVLDMGESVKIKDLACKMVHLSGFAVKGDPNPLKLSEIEIVCTGLRPGEKLYEELLIGENVEGTEHAKIMTAYEVDLDWANLKLLLDKLDIACHEFDQSEIRKLLLEAPTGFNPTDNICDLVWTAKNTGRDLTLVS